MYAQYGGCRTCQTPLSQLIMLDVALDMGMVAMGGIFFDPFVEEVVIVEDGPFVEEIIIEDFGGGDIW